MIEAVTRAMTMALAMGWEILWPLILGFALSAVVQAAVSHRQMSQLLPDDRPRSIATALALGAASSSCSYAAVALARSIFRKVAHFTAAMAFEMASTNLVFELTIIMVALLGWQLTLAEFVGAPLMVLLLVLLFRTFLTQDLLEQAKIQADKGVAGRMEGHAEMDMSVTEGGSLWQRMTSDRGLTAAVSSVSFTSPRGTRRSRSTLAPKNSSASGSASPRPGLRIRQTSQMTGAFP